jgi:hypothetical protein
MSNYPVSHDKTIYDIFNMINPNCYQAFIIQYIIENRKEEALKCCDELATAIEYYKWDSSGKQSSYVDSLICESKFAKWQKLAIIHIIANDVKSCKRVIEGRIKEEASETEKRIESAKKYKEMPFNSFKELCSLFGFESVKL